MVQSGLPGDEFDADRVVRCVAPAVFPDRPDGLAAVPGGRREHPFDHAVARAVRLDHPVEVFADPGGRPDEPIRQARARHHLDAVRVVRHGHLRDRCGDVVAQALRGVRRDEVDVRLGTPNARLAGNDFGLGVLSDRLGVRDAVWLGVVRRLLLIRAEGWSRFERAVVFPDVGHDLAGNGVPRGVVLPPGIRSGWFDASDHAPPGLRVCDSSRSAR